MAERRPARLPLDRHPYERDSRSCLASPNVPDGTYVYVQADDSNVWMLPDGLHLHPKVLGHCRPALYAGDMTIRKGVVVDLTNLSGTFQFDDEAGLIAVAEQLEKQGFILGSNAIRFFPSDGSRPIILG